MAKYVIDEEALYGIADAIRQVNQTNKTYTPEEMAAAVREMAPGEIDPELVKQIVDEYLRENPPTPNITINGEGPDENGNFVINTQPAETNNVVEF